MTIKLLSKRQYNSFTYAAKKIIKCNLCNGISAQKINDNYKYLLILDFEATCDNPQMKIQEIIEFPCLKININNFSEEGRFHHYVKPVIQPILSNFCVELTGILQEIVDEAETFPEVFEKFQSWRAEEDLTEENSLYITSGDWDLGHMLPEQCAHNHLEVPSHMKVWTDVKKLFGYNNKTFCNSLSEIMRHYNLKFQGRQHSGIDDCCNILQVVKKMLESGIEFRPTSTLASGKVRTVNSPLKGEANIQNGSFMISGKNYKKRG